MTTAPNGEKKQPDDNEKMDRLVALAGLESWLERPMQVLGLVWLALLVLEFTRGISPLLEAISTAIWVIFILDFALRLTLAPDRMRYLRGNWLTVLSLLVPALRVFRVARAVRVLRLGRAARGIRMVRVVGSLNRGMRSLGRAMERRGIGYVVALTTLVLFGGAAGMYAFESGLPGGQGLPDYPSAVWWTAMIMTTLGSEYWPRTAEGRLLCVMLALYAFAVFGYVTASLASFFIGRDAERDDTEIAGRNAIEALRSDIAALHEEVRALRGADARR